LVAGASSYSVYSGGIEIEIDTKPEYRRKGLATACGSKLILECLKRGLYPSWDAYDLRSAALAKKLGYQIDRPYVVFIKK
jgi:predicted GNAT family acetyltransferase